MLELFQTIGLVAVIFWLYLDRQHLKQVNKVTNARMQRLEAANRELFKVFGRLSLRVGKIKP